MLWTMRNNSDDVILVRWHEPMLRRRAWNASATQSLDQRGLARKQALHFGGGEHEKSFA